MKSMGESDYIVQFTYTKVVAYLVVVLYPHTQGVDKYCCQYPSLKIPMIDELLELRLFWFPPAAAHRRLVPVEEREVVVLVQVVLVVVAAAPPLVAPLVRPPELALVLRVVEDEGGRRHVLLAWNRDTC